MSKRQKPKITFGVDDLRTPEQLERVLRQFEGALSPAPKAVAPNLDELASILGPQIRDMLQGTGRFPINLQSLLPGVSTGQFLEDTHANRLASFPPGNYAVGTVFYETDRTTYYIVNPSKLWECIPGGCMKGTLDPDEKPTDLTAGEDLRFEFWSTDFSKYFIWTGADWERRGDQLQKGFIQMAAIGPAAGIPGWQICVAGDSLVTLADGTRQPIQDIVDNRVDCHVLAYNSESQQVEPRRVLDWFKSPAQTSDWLCLNIMKGKGSDRRCLYLTKEHPVYLADVGWTRADLIRTGDRVLRFDRTLTARGTQALLGMRLGDGNIDRSNNTFRVSHGLPQRAYLEWIAQKLQTNVRSAVASAGYGKGRTSVKTSVALKTLAPNLLQLLPQSGIVNEGVLNALGPAGLALWYCDDGNLQLDKRFPSYYRAQIHTEGLSPDELDGVADWFERTHAIRCRLYRRNNTAGRLLRMDAEGSRHFLDLIAPYTPPPMRYKLPSQLRGVPFADADWIGTGPVAYDVISIRPLDSHVKVHCPSRFQYRYDIKVEGLHSFVANGFIVHNCDGSTVLSSRDDGTTENVTVPDYTSAPYVKVGGVALIGPSAATGTVTAEALHTHDVAIGSTESGVNSIDASVRSDTPPGLTVANTGHTHDVDFGTVISAAGSSHTHGPGTLELANTQLRAYYRL